MEKHLDQLKKEHKELIENDKKDEKSTDGKKDEKSKDDEKKESTINPKASSNSAAGPKKEDPEKMAKRISHLELLIKFIQTELGYLLEIRRKIEDRSLDKIAFEQLWHLFTPGSLTSLTSSQ